MNNAPTFPEPQYGNLHQQEPHTAPVTDWNVPGVTGGGGGEVSRDTPSRGAE
jgi:hypothetical protein